MSSHLDNKKRKAQESYHHNSQYPAKRNRFENGHPSSHGGHSQGYRPYQSQSQLKPAQLPHPLPQLPHISSAFSEAVFTHSSIAVQSPSDPNHTNYERLEVVGDALLKDLATWVIFTSYPCLAPKRMSTIREALDKNETLCRFARAYGFDKKIRSASMVQPGQNHQKDWNKIHADVFEAYIAAVVLSAENRHKGFDIALDWLHALWRPMLEEMNGAKARVQQAKDVKSKEELAKQVMVKGVKLEYLEERPPVKLVKQGTQIWTVGCYLTGWGYDNLHLGSGEADSKHEAGQNAAANALNNPIVTEEIREKRQKYLEEHNSSTGDDKKDSATTQDAKSKEPKN